jgi:hypothetical protein
VFKSLCHSITVIGSVENELIFAIRKNIVSENIVFRELLITLIRAIQARFIYTIDSLSMISIY